jgi:hypothetical protein
VDWSGARPSRAKLLFGFLDCATGAST